MQSIVNKLFYLHLFSFCFHFMALLYKSGKFLFDGEWADGSCVCMYTGVGIVAYFTSKVYQSLL